MLPLPKSRQEIEDIQRTRKRRALEQARRAPFYAGKLDHIDLHKLDEPEEWRKIPILTKDMLRGLSDRDFYAPGSLLHAQLEREHPLCYGLPADIPIWSEGSPAWETQEKTVARYPDSGILASGWLLGETLIAKRSALVDAKIGSGHVLLFGMRPQYRAQSYLTFKLFFNALLYQ